MRQGLVNCVPFRLFIVEDKGIFHHNRTVEDWEFEPEESVFDTVFDFLRAQARFLNLGFGNTAVLSDDKVYRDLSRKGWVTLQLTLIAVSDLRHVTLDLLGDKAAIY